MEILTAILLLFGAILVHEGGHALMATALKIPFKQFSIGIPWPKWTTLRWGKFTFSPWLALAFVMFDDEVFKRAPKRHRVMVYLAGPAANFAVGLVTCFAVFGPNWGWYVSGEVARVSAESTINLFTGVIPLSFLSGPIGIVAAAYEILQTEFWIGITLVWVVLNFGIPFTNILPIPGLDGGQIIMTLLETEKRQAMLGRVTTYFALTLLAIIAVLSVKDVIVLFLE